MSSGGNGGEFEWISPITEDLQQFGSLSRVSGSRTSIVPNLNDPLSEDNNEASNLNDEVNTGYAEVIVDSDEDGEVSLDTDSSEGEDDDKFDGSLLNCTIADFTAWIRRQGGMGTIVSSLLPTHPLPADTSNLVSSQLNNWLLPIISIDTSDSPIVWDLEAILDSELSEGSMFWSKKDLYVAVGLWHMEHHVEFKVSRSHTSRVEYSCRRSGNCTFLLRATARDGCWLVYKFNPEHSCIRNLNSIKCSSIRSKAVAAYFVRSMRRRGSLIKPRYIMDELQQTFSVKISYSNAFRARNGAISMLYGGLKESFQMLPKYLEVLVQCNLGTITDLDIAADGHFQHLFVSLGVCRSAFNSSLLRQVIVLDATHLKGRNKGVLLVSVTKDGNEQVFPLAIGVARIENDESWRWFLSRLRIALGSHEQLLFVSDQHISISNAMSTIYPDAKHGLCSYHLQNKLTMFGAPIVKLYHKAAYAYRSIIYQKAMDQIQEHCPAAYNKLISIGPEKWARSQCSVRRFSFLTSNAAEVFNSRLLDARRLPICSIIDQFRDIIEKWFDQRRAKAVARNDELTEEAVAKLTPLAELSNTYTTVEISEHKFKFNDRKRMWNVDLKEKVCDCREFQLDLIPCSHAVAAIRMKGDIYDYIFHYYKTSNWREIYGGIVHSLPPKEEWVVSTEAEACVVLPPIVTRQVG